mmetsp:Transcript_1306/g.3322  ORF Transcript_1306/g.3322 Transcript_1306/m.3322 type:complete len:309 (-) Transcript_1306:167-1093(-)
MLLGTRHGQVIDGLASTKGICVRRFEPGEIKFRKLGGECVAARYRALRWVLVRSSRPGSHLVRADLHLHNRKGNFLPSIETVRRQQLVLFSVVPPRTLYAIVDRKEDDSHRRKRHNESRTELAENSGTRIWRRHLRQSRGLSQRRALGFQQARIFGVHAAVQSSPETVESICTCHDIFRNLGDSVGVWSGGKVVSRYLHIATQTRARDKCCQEMLFLFVSVKFGTQQHCEFKRARYSGEIIVPGGFVIDTAAAVVFPNRKQAGALVRISARTTRVTPAAASAGGTVIAAFSGSASISILGSDHLYGVG